MFSVDNPPVVEYLGQYGDVLYRLPLGLEREDWWSLCESISIRWDVPVRKEHFPTLPGFPDWDAKRKISDLPEPPQAVR